jgi:hypothetical protein
MKPRMRVRTPASKGSNHFSPRKSVPSADSAVVFMVSSRRFYGIRFHGVISIAAPTPIRFEQTNWRLRHLQIPTIAATAPTCAPTDSNREGDVWPNAQSGALLPLIIPAADRHTRPPRKRASRRQRKAAGRPPLDRKATGPLTLF